MSRPNQMVTVGAGKERYAGPSVFERFHQGSEARTRAIEAARRAELDRKVTPIADLTSGQITKRKLGIVAGVTASLVTLIAIACKGGQGQEVKATPTQPANSPAPTETIAATPTPNPEPIPSPELTQIVPKKLADAEFVPTDVNSMIKSIDDAYNPELYDTSKYIFKSSGQIKREDFDLNIVHCQSTNVDDILVGCNGIIQRMYYFHEQTGYEGPYLAAVAACNYLVGKGSYLTDQVKEFLLQAIGQTCPQADK
ncbi:hypothetical protein A3D07_03780 [Candidatus Curtissbacteria bacterium RIFCSPHIGHO2_02_FULL_42_15]|uniref:Uncharacterized protein n=1 Tax=Candidatus Curtissbacteria bacterium RIFCSPHIGHO2_02_FULL_42_15 TaxID=1797716 RepID=A0A1F5GJE6_9BACT|nr:MAG: hypothetical protein A3D07_03780 [Candidatus Curtissbacteria bacterium RIFCSPHIGHO2_02_FULL_42_15]